MTKTELQKAKDALIIAYMKDMLDETDMQKHLNGIRKRKSYAACARFISDNPHMAEPSLIHLIVQLSNENQFGNAQRARYVKESLTVAIADFSLEEATIDEIHKCHLFEVL